MFKFFSLVPLVLFLGCTYKIPMPPGYIESLCHRDNHVVPEFVCSESNATHYISIGVYEYTHPDLKFTHKVARHTAYNELYERLHKKDKTAEVNQAFYEYLQKQKQTMVYDDGFYKKVYVQVQIEKIEIEKVYP